MTVNTSDNRYATANFIVAPTLAEGANYTTVQAAINAASSGSTVFIKPGTYTEDITAKAGVTLTTFAAPRLANFSAKIVGKISYSEAGMFVINGLNLTTNSDYFLEITGSAASLVNIEQCYLSASNNTGISATSSSSAVVYVRNCIGDIGTTGISFFAMGTNGAIQIEHSSISNSGSSTTASTVGEAATGNVFYSALSFHITTSSTGSGVIYYSRITTNSTNTTCLTLAGTGNYQAAYSSFFSGTATAATAGTGTTLTARKCVFDTTNTDAISGAGTFNFGDLSFSNSSSLVSTTTQNAYLHIPGAVNTVMPAGDYTLVASDYFVGATTSAARAITLMAGPRTGQTCVVKDITGTAATFNITVSGNGNNILGSASAATYVINVDYGSATFIYNGTNWCVV